MSHLTIDLNADLGEGEPHDALLLTIVSSCNIACGGHIGNAQSMAETVRLATHHGVCIGAHPSYPDREGFGRRSRFLRGDDLRASLNSQLESLAVVCKSQGAELRTLKAHGALYNDAAKDAELAAMLVDLAEEFSLSLVGLPQSATHLAAVRAGIHYLAEGFVDRAYQADGSLSPRGSVGALIEDPTLAAEQALRLARRLPIPTTDGGKISPMIDTLCLHGDTPNAAEIARAVEAGLDEAAINVASPNDD